LRERVLYAVRTVLVVAAEPRELRGILWRCGRVKKLSWPVRFARSAELNGQRLLLVAHGPGRRLVSEALDVALREGRADAVVSAGFCGALDASLEVGEVFVATRVENGGAAYEAAEPATGQRFRSGTLVSTDHVVGSVAEKQRLGAGGAAAVEMEAAAVAGQAGQHGLPFYCVRAVLDRATEGFPLDFNELRSPDGWFSRPRILRAALARPWAAVPQLMRLERQGRLAARALGEFLANCRF
jgi:adenosylhomocysteine nucleosidase